MLVLSLVLAAESKENRKIHQPDDSFFSHRVVADPPTNWCQKANRSVKHKFDYSCEELEFRRSFHKCNKHVCCVRAVRLLCFAP
jgi:hypothetical protein